MQLDEQQHKIKILEEEKKDVDKLSQIEIDNVLKNFETLLQEKRERLHTLKDSLDQNLDQISMKQRLIQDT
jgi:hypothetical protein